MQWPVKLSSVQLRMYVTGPNNARRRYRGLKQLICRQIIVCSCDFCQFCGNQIASEVFKRYIDRLKYAKEVDALIIELHYDAWFDDWSCAFV